MKNIIVVTGGAGFIGSNLIELLIKKTSFNIISYDNYSSGSTANHISSNKVKYLKGDTLDFYKNFNKIKKILKWFFILLSFQEYFKVLKT